MLTIILSRHHQFGLVALGWLFILTGCTTNQLGVSGFETLAKNSSILLMPPDIEYFRVTASGMTEPNADWTQEARASFNNAFHEYSQTHQLQVIELQRDDMNEIAVEYDKLHSAIGNTILINHFGPAKLPAKQGAFDWSVGPDVNQITQNSDQQYALFTHYRDFQASGGRVGVAVLASLVGAAVYTGHQTGFASLVDLKTGNVIWFNHIPLAQGSMRAESGAKKLVTQLFKGLAAPE